MAGNVPGYPVVLGMLGIRARTRLFLSGRSRRPKMAFLRLSTPTEARSLGFFRVPCFFLVVSKPGQMISVGS